MDIEKRTIEFVKKVGGIEISKLSIIGNGRKKLLDRIKNYLSKIYLEETKSEAIEIMISFFKESYEKHNESCRDRTRCPVEKGFDELLFFLEQESVKMRSLMNEKNAKHTIVSEIQKKNITVKGKFKILSIDGGGIKGVFPAKILAELEAKLKADGKEKWQIYQNFDLICGTSTGGILAIALALGIPALEIHDFYLDNAKKIFGKKRSFFRQLFKPSHNSDVLEGLLRNKFKEVKHDNSDPRLADCKTSVCVPIFDLLNGQPSVLKTKHNERYTSDFHIPAYQAAMATSAAPTYFKPYNSSFTDLNGTEQSLSNRVDGGVVANNPSLIGLIEAQEGFYKELSDVSLLSIGTGIQKFKEARSRRDWGLWFWMRKPRLINLFMQGQSQSTEYLIRIMQVGVDKERKKNPSFDYLRINTEFSRDFEIAIDCVHNKELRKLSEKGGVEFTNHAQDILNNYCKEKDGRFR